MKIKIITDISLNKEDPVKVRKSCRSGVLLRTPDQIRLNWWRYVLYECSLFSCQSLFIYSETAPRHVN